MNRSEYPPLSLHIAGESIQAGKREILPVLNPATGEVLGELPVADAADLDRALAAAKHAAKSWRHSSPDERAKVLRGAAALLRERCEIIARIATMEEGKTLFESRFETMAAANLFDFYAEECRRTYGRVLVRPTGTRSVVLKEPIGPVAAFAPWNFPIHNPVRKLSAPIAAGCPVILKPAEEAPASALAVMQALVDAGLPSGVAQVVFGVPDMISRHLLSSPVIRKVSFTGSTIVGKHLMRLAADNAIPTTMELGGHGPVIVFDDADLERSVETLAIAKSRNAGQVCVSPTRFYVQEGIYERFVDAFAKRLSTLKIDDGLVDSAQMGPMANSRRIPAIEALLADAVSHGAQVRAGGERIDRPGFFFRPTVLSDVSSNARIMSEEPFGPVAIMARFTTFDDAVEKANSLPYGLASYAFTQSAQTVLRIGDALESGMVGINTTAMAAPDAPFGGVKESGHGSEDGPEGLAEFLVTKTVHQH